MRLLWCVVPLVFLTGCAYLANSRRPPYDGPIAKPLWTVRGLASDATPVIYDGVAYIRARTLDSENKRLFALDLKTGKKLWTSGFTPGDIKFFINPLLFVVDDKGVAHSLDAKTGRDIFQPTPTHVIIAKPAGTMLYAVLDNATIQAMDNPQHVVWSAQLPMKYFGAPVIESGNVYVPGRVEKDGVAKECRIHAFDAQTGAERWQWTSGSDDESISKLVADSGTVYAWVGKSEGRIVAVDAATGRTRWTVTNNQYFADGPTFFDASTLLTRDSVPKALRFRGVKRATGEVAWESTTAWKYDKWTAEGERLYVGDRQAHAVLNEGGDTSPDSWLTAVDIRTGKEVWRSAKVELGDFTEPAVAAGIVVVGSWPYQFQNKDAAFVAAFGVNQK
jgi:outer membrane protein assembly factor BamB